MRSPRYRDGLCLYGLGLACCLWAVVVRAEEPTTEVKLDDITLKVPATWKKVPVASRLRLAQFEIPAAEGDEQPAELAVHYFGGAAGGVQANVDRWIGQFRSEGRKTSTQQGTSPQGEYVVLEVSGTYNRPVGPPVLQKTEPMPNARMIAVILAIPEKGNYFLKLTGPQKTVAAAGQDLRKSFGADMAKEKPVGEPQDGEKR